MARRKKDDPAECLTECVDSALDYMGTLETKVETLTKERDGAFAEVKSMSQSSQKLEMQIKDLSAELERLRAELKVLYEQKSQWERVRSAVIGELDGATTIKTTTRRTVSSSD